MIVHLRCVNMILKFSKLLISTQNNFPTFEFTDNDPDFPFWEIFFFSLLKSCKISCFCPKLRKIWLKIFENNRKYFSKIVLKNVTFLFFFRFLYFLGVIFATRMQKIFKKKVPTNLRRSVHP